MTPDGLSEGLSLCIRTDAGEGLFFCVNWNNFLPF